jgi:ankyrin repeat protein
VNGKRFNRDEIRYLKDRSALMLACFYGNASLVECLLSHGASVNLQNSRVYGHCHTVFN